MEIYLFSGAVISDVANFKNTTFQRNASFVGTRFIGPADFSNSSFDRPRKLQRFPGSDEGALLIMPPLTMMSISPRQYQ